MNFQLGLIREKNPPISRMKEEPPLKYHSEIKQIRRGYMMIGVGQYIQLRLTVQITLKTQIIKLTPKEIEKLP